MFKELFWEVWDRLEEGSVPGLGCGSHYQQTTEKEMSPVLVELDVEGI